MTGDFDEEDPQASGGERPAASLLVLVQSLGLTALANLGERPMPGAAEPELDLAEAKYAIDLLQVLRNKTAGNRTDEEDLVLDRLLYDLRMKYVARASKR